MPHYPSSHHHNQEPRDPMLKIQALLEGSTATTQMTHWWKTSIFNIKSVQKSNARRSGSKVRMNLGVDTTGRATVLFDGTLVALFWGSMSIFMLNFGCFRCKCFFQGVKSCPHAPWLGNVQHYHAPHKELARAGRFYMRPR